MPVVITTVLSPDVTIEVVRLATAEMAAARPVLEPAGLIAHAVTFDPSIDSIRIVDMWESVAAYDDFAQNQLAPAVRKVAAAHGQVLPAPVSSETAEALIFSTGSRVLPQ